MERVISAINQKGGTGKTTSVVSLAHCLVKKGYKVLIIDLDPQANATLSFNIYPGDFSASIAKVLIDDSTALSSIIMPTRIKDIYLAPADASLGSVDINLANSREKQFKLKKKIDSLNFKCDLVLIDCPPSLGLLPVNALVASRYVLIPMLAKYLALEGLKQMTISIEKIRRELNPDLEVLGILFCMVDLRLQITQPSIDLVRESFKDKVFERVISFCPEFDEATVVKETILEYAPDSQGALDYNNVTESILKILGNPPRNFMRDIFSSLADFLKAKKEN
jgi:chromosome partitioning protein